LAEFLIIGRQKYGKDFVMMDVQSSLIALSLRRRYDWSNLLKWSKVIIGEIASLRSQRRLELAYW